MPVPNPGPFHILIIVRFPIVTRIGVRHEQIHIPILVGDHEQRVQSGPINTHTHAHRHYRYWLLEIEFVMTARQNVQIDDPVALEDHVDGEALLLLQG